MPKASWSIAVLIAAGLIQTLPLPLPGAAALAQTETSSRPIAVVLPQAASPLNSLLLQILRKELPGYEPVLITTPYSGEAAALLADLAQSEDNPLLPNSYGGQTFPEAEAGWLKQAGLIILPRWNYSEMTLSGPHAPATDNDYWTLRSESDLTLSVDIYKAGQAEPLARLSESFKPFKPIPIRDLDQLVKLVKDVSGVDVDITNSLHQALVLDVLRKVPSFQQMLAENPATYLAAESTQAVTLSGLRQISAGIRAQGGFSGTRPQPSSNPVASGASGAKPGFTVALRGGTSPLWLADQNTMTFGPQAANFFAPNVELDFQYDVGQFINFPDFAVTLSGGGTFVLAPFPGSPSATAITGELGLLKRWFFGPWSLDTGLSGGILFGLMPFPNPQFGTLDNLTTLGFQGTARVGGSYQFNPNFSVGLHTGFRFASADFWSQAVQPGFPAQPNPSLPLLGGWGPLIQLTASYTF